MADVVYSIAGLRFALHLSHPIKVTRSFLPFTAPDGPTDICVTFTPVSSLPAIGGKEIFRDLFHTIHKTKGCFRRCYIDHLDHDRPYALADYDWDTGREVVQYEADTSRFFSESQNSFSHIGFEEILMSRQRLILHAALIDTPLGGILFSGPSGIGKSTQADLWHACEGSSIINGDRPILHCEDGVWQAWGSPYAGSSGYYVNQKVPIRAIVMLEQGPDCLLQMLSGMQAFCQLYAQTTSNSWDPRYVECASGLLQSLVASVPVYHYACTPDAKAVQVLKEALS